jgi:glycosyltransferase involved in cell wall biosynthesis
VGPLWDQAAQEFRGRAPPNVIIRGEVPKAELISEYQRAKIYAQLSLFEGLPNALAEAMLCECVPVGTPGSGIPTLIGDCGFYVPVQDPIATAEGIQKASRSDLGSRARARVAQEFPIERREKALCAIISELSGR